MGIQRPDGPYSIEMTAGPAWPGADENTYRDRADELRATLRSLTSTCEQWEQQRATLFNGDLVWSGDAATAAAAEVDKRTAAMRTLQDQLRAAATQADTTATVIGAVKTQVTENVETAQKIIDQINNTPAATAEQKSAAIEQVVTATHATNTAAVAAGAAQLGAAPPATPLNFRPTNTAPPQAPAPKKEEIPPPGTDSETSKRWWHSHTPQEKEELIRDHADEIGHLDGVPPAIRDRALRSVVEADHARVDRVAADRHVGIDEIRAHPENFGLTPKDLLRYDQADRANAGLRELSRKTNAPTMLMIYQPEAFGGQGRAAIVIGDPDRATNVAVVVPGTSHSLAEGWLGTADDPANVYLEMKGFGDRNAVYAWMGYDAPDSLTDPRVATTALAREGGRQLASDVNGLRSTAMVSQHYTVIGHSYGSTTVADAAVMGMKTNDVVLVGSPGTDLARSAADFHLASGGHVFVGATSTDPVTHIGAMTSTTPWGPGALGADPAVDGFGSTRFHAEVTAITDNANAHSHYFDTGSDSLRSMGLIASGNGDALQSNELTAAHRDGLHVPGGLLQPKDLAEVLAGQYAEGTLPQSLLEDLANGNPTRIGRIGGAVGVLVEDIYDDPEFGR